MITVFSKIIYMCIVKYIFLIKYFVIRDFRGTYSSVELLKGACSPVEVLKGYMVNKRLGTPGLYESDSHSWVDEGVTVGNCRIAFCERFGTACIHRTVYNIHLIGFQLPAAKAGMKSSNKNIEVYHTSPEPQASVFAMQVAMHCSRSRSPGTLGWYSQVTEGRT